ncbi:hypothetical protein FRC05_006182 [Tulasnella sp. 425]|nr:hypothetical protein FRC05_006182 [Tulasnella sp. 425]
MLDDREINLTEEAAIMLKGLEATMHRLHAGSYEISCGIAVPPKIASIAARSEEEAASLTTRAAALSEPHYLQTPDINIMILPSDKDVKSDYDAKSDSGITSFSASTDSPFKIDDPVREPVVRDNSNYPNPPPYDAAGPSSPPTGPPSGRVNHFYVHKGNSSVTGSYTVDVDLVVPPQLLPDTAPGEVLENLSLTSNNGSVKADVVLVGRGDKRASLVAKTHNGSAELKLLSRINCPFRLVAESWNGTVTVYLPRSFVGPVTSSTGNGRLDLSDAVKQNFTLFSDLDRRATKGFIGDWSSSGYGEVTQAGAEWMGDEIIAGTKNGSVKVRYIDEFNASGGGFFSSWFK